MGDNKNLIIGIVMFMLGGFVATTSNLNNSSNAENNVTINQENPGKIWKNQEISGKIRNFVDINNSDIETLKSLPGIGTKKAEEIISRRNKIKFTSIYQLLEEGILGVESFERNKNLIIAGD